MTRASISYEEGFSVRIIHRERRSPVNMSSLMTGRSFPGISGSPEPDISTIRVNGSGAIGYDEYIENNRIPDVFSFLCSFMGSKNEERRYEELVVLGEGEYDG